ncbi:MAG TPA: hypothetical protein VGE07_27625 [Herpetosiphonaceae bacterium]
MNKPYRSYLLRAVGGALVIFAIVWAALLLIGFFFPTTRIIESSTHFLSMTSNNPGIGSNVAWCPKTPSPQKLKNGDTVLGYECLPLGWIPFHAETPWP